MTLVVARQVSDEVYILGDTKFSDNDDRGWSESKKYIGGLKVILLAPGLCVGFAGNVEIARDAIQGIYDKGVNLFDKNRVIEHFLRHNTHSINLNPEDPAEFIVAVIIERSQQPGTFLKEIFRIADSNIYWENETTHIGGPNQAFNCFQEAFHNGYQQSYAPLLEITKLGKKERPGFDQSLSAAMKAMQDVIDNPRIVSVDGIRTVVISEEDQFKYVEYLQIRGTPIIVKNEPGAAVSFGDAAEGSSHWHIGMSSATGFGIFPAYSITGRFGLIYHPEECFEPQTYLNCSLEQFRLIVEERISAAHQRVLNYQAHF
jgi:hypothetical protein